MQNPDEFVVAAAVRLPSGEVYQGARHHHAIARAKRAVELAGSTWRPSWSLDQGFVLANGVYVSREEAMILVRKNKQLTPAARACGSDTRTELYSEDVW
jgi:hypothetical protein